jgi:hypothetical protein
MLKLAAIGLAAAAVFSDYPAFLKKGGVVEAYTDRGPIVEMIVRCQAGTGIVSYSKVDQRFCSSKMHCYGRLHAAIAETCG